MNEEMDDAALVDAARGGDKAAFAELLVRHRPLLLALCRRALGDPLLAEDAAQEATLQAMLCLDALRQPRRFGAWLAGSGLNVCRGWLRQSARNSWSWEAMQGGVLRHEPADAQPGPAEAAEATELRERVHHVVGGLPSGQRAAVLLFYLAGMTHAETAAQLGIEVGTVKTRLHKARRALKRQLWQVWEERGMTAQTGEAVEMRVIDVLRRREDGDRLSMMMVVLEEADGPRRLTIWVGEAEGIALALALEKIAVPRPLTYTFMAGVLEAGGGRLRDVRITRLADDAFYATATVDGPGGTNAVDARPSDALNLALVTGAPVRVEREVLDRWEAIKASHAADADETSGVDAQIDLQRLRARPETPEGRALATERARHIADAMRHLQHATEIAAEQQARWRSRGAFGPAQHEPS